MDNIYENIKIICAQQKITVAQVESDLGYTEGSLANWKKERRWMTQIRAVAHKLDVSIDRLFYGEEYLPVKADMAWLVDRLASLDLNPKETKAVAEIAEVLHKAR